MKKIFFIYWFSYLLILLIMIINPVMPTLLSKIIGATLQMTMFYLLIAPWLYLIYCDKGHHEDEKYLNANVGSGIVRAVIWYIGYLGVKDYNYILALNGFGMLVYVLIESKLKQIDKEYFNF